MGGALAVTFADLAEILRRELGADQASRACAALCREAAGESCYIPRRPGRPEIREGDTAKAVQARYPSFSERTARNWVNRWRS